MDNIHLVQWDGEHWADEDVYLFKFHYDHADETFNNVIQTFRLTLIRE